jgi:hypothetical protein
LFRARSRSAIRIDSSIGALVSRSPWTSSTGAVIASAAYQGDAARSMRSYSASLAAPDSRRNHQRIAVNAKRRGAGRSSESHRGKSVTG